jgi:hypothetical protein
MSYFQDLGADAVTITNTGVVGASGGRISKTVPQQLVEASVEAGRGTSNSATAYAELVTMLRAIAPVDREAAVQAALAIPGVNAAVLSKALAEANAPPSRSRSIAGTALIVGGVAVGAYLLFGRRRR